jgi:hypothetical protein
MTFKLRPYQEAAIRALQANPVSTMYLPWSGEGAMTIARTFNDEAAVDGVLTLETLARVKATLLQPKVRLFDIPVATEPQRKPLVIRPVRPDYYRASIEVQPMRCPFKITLIALAVRNVLGGRYVL